MIPMAKRMQSCSHDVVWVRERIVVAVIRQCKAAAVINSRMRGIPFDAYIMPELKRRDYE